MFDSDLLSLESTNFRPDVLEYLLSLPSRLAHLARQTLHQCREERRINQTGNAEHHSASQANPPTKKRCKRKAEPHLLYCRIRFDGQSFFFSVCANVNESKHRLLAVVGHQVGNIEVSRLDLRTGTVETHDFFANIDPLIEMERKYSKSDKQPQMSWTTDTRRASAVKQEETLHRCCGCQIWRSVLKL